jgi:hypothetical protein
VKAETKTLQGVFHGDRRFVVPVYQRPYVWEQVKQWEPLWDDVEATAIRLGETRLASHDQGTEATHADKRAAPHFLGAIVIEDKPVMTGDVDTRLVVDGQQRLTTIQLLIRGVLDALDSHDTDKRGRARLRKAVENDPDVVQPQMVLKMAPRRSELEDFELAMIRTNFESSDSKFAAARAFFAKSAASFLADDEIPQDPYTDGSPADKRASLLVSTLLGLVKLVVIDLEDTDDAQIIFESLNARGTPLSASDLVKNLLFLRAEAHHLDAEELYDSYWRRFDDDDDWWLQAVGTGHAQRPRQDWLLGDWLIAQLARSISVGRLYSEFRNWLDETGTKPFDALSTLSKFADAYEVLNGRRPGATERELLAYKRIEILNITVATPALLELFVQPPGVLSPEERELAVVAIESFVIRRMLTKEQTRSYGLLFVDVLKSMREPNVNPGAAVISSLRAGPHGYPWPSSETLADAFTSSRYYGSGGINQERLRMVLGAIDERLQSMASKSESFTFEYNDLQIEHIIPQEWRTYWPLDSTDPAALVAAEQERDRAIHRIGNLTLATGPLNASLSNDPWKAKKAELAKHSKLELNALLVSETDWNESRIAERGQWLASQIDEIWPGPDDIVWDEPVTLR